MTLDFSESQRFGDFPIRTHAFLDVFNVSYCFHMVTPDYEKTHKTLRFSGNGIETTEPYQYPFACPKQKRGSLGQKNNRQGCQVILILMNL